VPNFVLVVLGAIFGAATGLLWYYGFIQFVRDMIPYALVIAVILFVVTAVLKARCGNMAEGLLLTSTCSSLRKYSGVLMIAAAIFIVFSIIVLATFLPFVARVILAFIGSVTFFTMLFEFVGMIFCMLYRR
jgi:hypothetical protein